MEDFAYPLPDLVFCVYCHAFHRKAETRREYIKGLNVCLKKPWSDNLKKKKNTGEPCTI